MKHLKTYKIFERQTNEHLTLMDIYQEFFDKWGYEIPDYVDKYPNSHNITLYSDEYALPWRTSGLPRFEISDSWVFGAGDKQNCIMIRITNSSGSSNTHMIKNGVYKNFDGITNTEFSQDLQECHQRAIDYLKPVDVIVGSLGEYTKDLDIIYFKEKPDFSRCGDVEIYGSNTAIYLDKLGMWLISNSRHPNIFSSYSEDRSKDSFMCYLQGYGDSRFFYHVGEEIIYKYREDSSLHRWVVSEWDKVCKKLNIKDRQKIRSREKITIPEFMTHLKNNQDTYEV